MPIEIIKIRSDPLVALAYGAYAEGTMEHYWVMVPTPDDYRTFKFELMVEISRGWTSRTVHICDIRHFTFKDEVEKAYEFYLKNANWKALHAYNVHTGVVEYSEVPDHVQLY